MRVCQSICRHNFFARLHWTSIGNCNEARERRKRKRRRERDASVFFTSVLSDISFSPLNVLANQRHWLTCRETYLLLRITDLIFFSVALRWRNRIVSTRADTCTCSRKRECIAIRDAPFSAHTSTGSYRAYLIPQRDTSYSFRYVILFFKLEITASLRSSRVAASRVILWNVAVIEVSVSTPRDRIGANATRFLGERVCRRCSELRKSWDHFISLHFVIKKKEERNKLLHIGLQNNLRDMRLSVLSRIEISSFEWGKIWLRAM